MTLEESFKLIVMFFGLINSVAIFKMMMNKILQDLINTDEVASFINNIIIETKKEEKHNKVVEEIIKRLAENNLYIRPEKCKQKIKEIEFLGIVIGLDGVRIEKEKMKGVLDWLTFQEVKDIQKLLRLANYYWQFIKNFIFIARLLYDLMKKDQKWGQTERQKKVFRELKEKFTKKLAASDLDKKMRMKVNVLDYTTVKVVNNELDFILFSFFFILDLGKGCDVISYMTKV